MSEADSYCVTESSGLTNPFSPFVDFDSHLMPLPIQRLPIYDMHTHTDQLCPTVSYAYMLILFQMFVLVYFSAIYCFTDLLMALECLSLSVPICFAPRISISIDLYMPLQSVLLSI